jgi:hypothetical protein
VDVDAERARVRQDLLQSAFSTVTSPLEVPPVSAVSGTTVAPDEPRWMCAAVTSVRPLTVSVRQSSAEFGFVTALNSLQKRLDDQLVHPSWSSLGRVRPETSGDECLACLRDRGERPGRKEARQSHLVDDALKPDVGRGSGIACERVAQCGRVAFSNGVIALEHEQDESRSRK